MNIQSKSIKVILFSILLASPMAVLADDVVNTQEQSTTVENTSAKTTIYGTAKDWALTDAEWRRYQQLMTGPDGLWYRQMTPPAVLGMRAMDPVEQKHFAEVYAKQEHDKVARELSFNQAVFIAIRQLYPDEPLIKPFDVTPFNPSANRENHLITDDKEHGTNSQAYRKALH